MHFYRNKIMLQIIEWHDLLKEKKIQMKFPGVSSCIWKINAKGSKDETKPLLVVFMMWLASGLGIPKSCMLKWNWTPNLSFSGEVCAVKVK